MKCPNILFFGGSYCMSWNKKNTNSKNDFLFRFFYTIENTLWIVCLHSCKNKSVSSQDKSTEALASLLQGTRDMQTVGVEKNVCSRGAASHWAGQWNRIVLFSGWMRVWIRICLHTNKTNSCFFSWSARIFCRCRFCCANWSNSRSRAAGSMAEKKQEMGLCFFVQVPCFFFVFSGRVFFARGVNKKNGKFPHGKGVFKITSHGKQ